MSKAGGGGRGAGAKPRLGDHRSISMKIKRTDPILDFEFSFEITESIQILTCPRWTFLNSLLKLHFARDF